MLIVASLLLSDITGSFGITRALKDVELDIRNSEFPTLVDPSGCGKIRALRIIAGLDHADRGSVSIGEVADL